MPRSRGARLGRSREARHDCPPGLRAACAFVAEAQIAHSWAEKEERIAGVLAGWHVLC